MRNKVNPGAPPTHLQWSDAELLRDLEDQFRTDADFILGLRLEGRNEAIQRTSPTEGRFKHSRLIPFRRTDDETELRDHFDYAKSAIPELEGLFRVHSVTPKLLRCWGACRYACGYLTRAYFARGDDLGALCSGIEGPKAKSAP